MPDLLQSLGYSPEANSNLQQDSTAAQSQAINQGVRQDLLQSLGYSGNAASETPAKTEVQAPNIQQSSEGQFTPSALGMAGEALGQSLSAGNAMAGVKGIGEGAYQAAQGAGGQLLKGANALNLVSDDTLNEYNAKTAADERSFNQDNPNGAAGRIAGNLMAWLGATSKLPFAGTGLGGAAASIGTGAALGALQPANSTDQTIQNAAIGGAVGALGSGVSQVIKTLSDVKAAEPIINALANPGTLKSMAEDLIDKGSSGENIVDTLSNHIKNTASTLQTQGEGKYNAFFANADAQGQPIALNNTQQRIKAALESTMVQKPGFQLDGTDDVLKRLSEMQTTLQQQPNVSGKEFQDMRTVLSKIAQTAPTDLEQTTAKSLLGGIQQDLESFANKSDPTITGQYNDAKSFWANNYKNFTNNKLIAKYLDPVNQSQPQVMNDIFKTFMRPTNPGALEALHATPELTEQLGNQTISNAFSDAVKTGDFNPKAFIGSINKNASLNQLTMSPDKLEKLQGYANLLKTVDNPQAGIVANFANNLVNKTSATLGSTAKNNGPWLLSKALTTEPTASLFNTAAKVPPNSPAAKRLVSSAIIGLSRLNSDNVNPNTDIGFMTPSKIESIRSLPESDDESENAQ